MLKIIIAQPTIPVKRHIKKRWMSNTYHLRIQKKWAKRFGYTYPDFILRGEVLLDKINNVAYMSHEQHHAWTAQDNPYTWGIDFPLTGSTIKGEAGDNIGRGRRSSVYNVGPIEGKLIII